MATEQVLARFEATLAAHLPAEDAIPSRLHSAMRYAVLGGGKRIRPRLVYATGELIDPDHPALDAAAIAVELIHGFSLVHDDLPAMDDDSLRRGRATVHVAFDEATAILAGDALQALAFRVLALAPADAGTRAALVATLADAAGSIGMCGGQQLDMDATGKRGQIPFPSEKGSDPFSLAALDRMHGLKTGALMSACVRMGALVGNADDKLLARLDGFAKDFGLAFQIRDDILDVESDAAQLGKTAGKDAAQDKATYVSVLGLDRSKALLAELAKKMQGALAPFDARADALRALAGFAVARVS
jgi:farnesyl diphosphate synthase